jgi:hypothetical protein
MLRSFMATTSLLAICIGIAGFAKAADKPDPYVIDVDVTVKLRLSTGKPIAVAACKEDSVARLVPVVNDPSAVLVTGMGPGKARVVLTDGDGKEEVFNIVVPRMAEVALGIPVSWSLPGDRHVKKAKVDDEKIARVQLGEKDAGTIRIEPKKPGKTRVLLTDGDGKTEEIELLVHKPHYVIAVGESITLQPLTGTPIQQVQVLYDPHIEWKIKDPKEKAELQRFPGKRLSMTVVKGAVTSIEVTGRTEGFCEVTLVDGKSSWPFRIGVKPKE